MYIYSAQAKKTKRHPALTTPWRAKVFNPATGEEVATFASAGSRDVDLAVSGALEAFEKGRWATKESLKQEMEPPTKLCLILAHASNYECILLYVYTYMYV